MAKRTDKLAPCHQKSTSKTDVHCTPTQFVDYLERAFKVHFTIDIAATPQNSMCQKFFTKKDDALKQNWTGVAWCNPPYSKAGLFVRHCYENAKEGHGTTFMLMASRTDIDWFHDFASKAYIVAWIKGRLKFVGGKGGAPFPSVLIVFKKGYKGSAKHIFLEPSPWERGFSRGNPNKEKPEVHTEEEDE